VVQICPGRFVCKQVTVCPGHIWTTLYVGSLEAMSTGNIQFYVFACLVLLLLYCACMVVSFLNLFTWFLNLFTLKVLRCAVVQVKLSRYSPGRTLAVQKVDPSRNFWQSARGGGRVVSPAHRPPLPYRRYSPALVFVRCWVDPKAIVRPEGLSLWKKDSRMQFCGGGGGRCTEY
jgi:hypothetical protein